MIEQLYRTNYNKYVNRYTTMTGSRSAAEDIVSEAFVRAVKYQKSYRPRKSTKETWFNSILRNSYNEYFRKEKDSYELTDNEPELVGWIKEWDNLDVVENAIRQHTEDSVLQSVLYNFYILGFSSKEISQFTEDYSISRITTVCHRFKKWMGFSKC